MVCCAWNLNIFNNETSFYEAKKKEKKKQQKCHDILRMSHCILLCHFHCIWWINKWWQKTLMWVFGMAFRPQDIFNENSKEDDKHQSGFVLWLKVKNIKQHITSAQWWFKKKIHKVTSLQHFKANSSHFFVAFGISSHYLGASKYWSLIKEWGRNSDPSVRLLKSSMLAYTSESIKPQTPGGATAGHKIIYQSLRVQCPHTVALTQSLNIHCGWPQK